METLRDFYKIREWMPFSDREIAMFQYFFIDYLKKNENKLSKIDCYKLAMLASETQYQMRLLKARINGDNNIDENLNNKYIKSIISFDGLIDFIKEKIIQSYEKTTLENKYELFKDSYSYFTTDEKIKDSIKKDFDLYFNI